MHDLRYEYSDGTPVKIDSIKIEETESTEEGEYSIQFCGPDCSGMTITAHIPFGRHPELKEIFGIPLSRRDIRLIKRHKEKQRRKKLKDGQ